MSKNQRLVKGKIFILCPKCGLDRGKEVGGIGEPCPRCGFKPKMITEERSSKP